MHGCAVLILLLCTTWLLATALVPAIGKNAARLDGIGNAARRCRNVGIFSKSAASSDFGESPAPPSSSSSSFSSSSVIASSSSGVRTTSSRLGAALPSGDELDKRIIALALPAIVNFAIVPLVGAVDTVFVGRMKNALALAGQGAANQVFSSTFWIISFLPSVVTPLIAQAVGSGDKDAVQDRVGESVFLGTLMGIIGCGLLLSIPHKALSMVLPAGAPALEYATPYLSIRALTFIPAILSTVGFAVFRGSMDVVTPLKISLVSNIVNVVLDPLFIFNANMGVAGAAAATCVAEVVGFFLYIRALLEKKLMRWSKIFRVPSPSQLKPILMGGAGVQLRAVALNIAFLAVTRTTQALDGSGTAAAAHAITLQLWQLGGVFLLAMSTVASIIVPSEVAKSKKSGEKGANVYKNGKFAAERMLCWGGIMGITLGIVQLLCLPLLSVFSPLKEIQEAGELGCVCVVCCCAIFRQIYPNSSYL